MYRRPHHQRIATLLGQLDHRLFVDTACLFAGGTAIAMQLDEFRRSDDLDFLCASAEGYRRLRERVFDGGIQALATGQLPLLREARADQYGIRAVLGDADAPVKFEIVREARIGLAAADERLDGIPLLARPDLYAEKLLANADRGLDKTTLHRDLIDLCVMVQHWGPIPGAALCKARAAYGDTVDQALSKVAARLADPATLRHCLTTLDADPALQSTIPLTLPTLTRRL